jgi:hypothetical protein
MLSYKIFTPPSGVIDHIAAKFTPHPRILGDVAGSPIPKPSLAGRPVPLARSIKLIIMSGKDKRRPRSSPA